jgi:hypothetical protein
MKKVAILQSNYIPWKGYFDLIAAVDEFIVYDIAQFTKNDWRNRNKIKTRTGPQWITIPVRQEKFYQTISETRNADSRWSGKHWIMLTHSYSRAPHFRTYASCIEAIYQEAGELKFLSEVNLLFIRKVCALLGIATKITSCADYEVSGDRVERLVGICRQAGASAYLSGPAAKDYLDETLFSNAGIALEWMDYSGYPVYDQLFPPFDHSVSILDLLFNVGPDAPGFMKRVNGASGNQPLSKEY